jgi:hypothetical protein
VTALGINAIPAGVVLVGGSSAETAMLLYFFENILAILFTAARVHILAPAHDEAYTATASEYTRRKVKGRIVFRGRTTRGRGALLTGYLLFSLGFSIATGVFLFLFLFLILAVNISRTVITSAMAGIAAFQLFHFVTDLCLVGRLSPRQAEMLLDQSMGRVALLYLAVGVGVFLTLLVEQWFVLPFALLKTIVDLARPIQALRVRNQRPELE